MTQVIGPFKVSPSSLNLVGCPHAMNQKWRGVPNEVPSYDELVVDGTDMHAIFDAINKTRHTLNDQELDTLLSRYVTIPDSIETIRRSVIRYMQYFPIFQVHLSEISLAVDMYGNPCDYDSDEAMIRGRIDAVLKPVDSEPGYAIILDHKTGYATYSADTFQNKVYAYLFHKHFPSYDKIGLAIHFSRSQTINYWQSTITDFVLLEKHIMIAAHKAWDTPIDAAPAPGKVCLYCPWPMTCPAVQDELVVVNSKESAERLAKEVIVLDKRAAEIKKKLKIYADRYGDIDIDAETCYGLGRRRTVTADMVDLMSKIGSYPSLIDHLTIKNPAGLENHPAGITIHETISTPFQVKKKGKSNEEEA